MKKIVTSLVGLAAITLWSSALILSTNVDISTPAKAPAPVVLQAPALGIVPSSNGWQSRPGSSNNSQHQVSVLSSRLQKPTPQVLAAETSNTSALTEDQAIDLDKPGVVSIINWFDGQASVPDFDVDIKTFALTARPDLEPHVLQTNWTLSGSGFVVNPNGYIITNAHVISKNSVLSQLDQDVSNHWNDIYKADLDKLTKKQYDQYQSYLDATFGTDASATDQENSLIDQAVAKYILANYTDNSTNSVVVVDKLMENRTLVPGQEVQQIFQGGLPATIVDYDKDFADSGKDVALLKIDQTNLPALPIGSSTGLVSGQKTLIFGFPSNARISNSDFFEPTLTEGEVGAIKDNNGQKIIQLDNKIAPGSSGGPLLDVHGNVIGITTYETAQTSDSQGGDNFGFALPIELAKDIMAKNNVENSLGVYGSNFLLGLSSQNNSACKSALNYYQLAEGVNSHFPADEQLTPREQSCQSLIASNQSKDSTWDILRIFYIEHQVNAIIFSLLVLVALGFGVIMAFRLYKNLRQQNNFKLPSIPMPR
jgi:S1-C subfamily serine protease